MCKKKKVEQNSEIKGATVQYCSQMKFSKYCQHKYAYEFIK